MGYSLLCSATCLIVIILIIKETQIINVAAANGGTRFLHEKNLDDLVALGPSVVKHPNLITVVHCAFLCSKDSRCLSFFYNKLTAICDLRDDIIGTAATTTSDPGSKHFVLNSGCSVVPTTIPNGHPQMNSTSLMWRVGEIVSVTCDPQHVLFGQLQCVGENTWSIPKCEIPSCSALKTCNSSAVDGEYWLYPAILKGQKVKVYCNNMSSGTPKEYITLKGNNSGENPDLSNKNCEGETASLIPNTVGVTSYTKIRINLNTMEVDTDDNTFSMRTSTDAWPYGTARDCYAIHYDGIPHCGGPKGTFTINTTSTGLVVLSTVTWKVFGWNSYMIVDRSNDGAVIRLICGGWEGGCRPDGPLVLKLNHNEVLPENSASPAEC